MPFLPASREPIAIVGNACRFAGGVTSPSKLWTLLKSPRDVLSKIPDSRFNVDGFYHQNHTHHGHLNVKHAYLIDQDPSLFDAEFFGINAMESRAMDPQQRQLLEVVYESIEAAGMTMEGLRGSDTSVYAGVMCGDYEAMTFRDLDFVPTYAASGFSRSILSNRISYFFDWHGPSMTVDTACSSSMVALHQAVLGLRAGESRMAVVCGSNLILGPEHFIIESKLKMLSPEGRSRMWDKDANGYARGEGVAAVVLKTLSSAIRDGDDILCLIRETGVGQDGATPGLTMPSPTAQQGLIQKTYARAGLDISSPRDRPQYFEAHGTGTSAGDRVESQAIHKAFFQHQDLTKGDHPLYVGSIKTILGHTEGTAGIAGLLRAALAIKHSTIPPNLLFDNLSPSVAPFYRNLEIVSAAQPWPKVLPSQPRRASVNSFGFGGTNAHVILESYESPTDAPPRTTMPLFTPFVFSAFSNTSLRANLEAYVAYLDQQPDLSEHDLAYTLRHRRSMLPYKIAFPASSLEDLKGKIILKLRNEDTGLGVRTSSRNSQTTHILGIFTGQGAQYARMGAELIEKSPFAQMIIEKLESYLAQLPIEDRPNWSLKAELLQDTGASRIKDAIISQPACTAIQILLVDILREAGINFHTVVGHSSGEIAAAYAAGYLTARDAMYVAYYRGFHSDKAMSPNGNIKGAMLAVGATEKDAQMICDREQFAGRIAIAAINSFSSITLSGDENAIQALKADLDDEKRFNRALRVDKAYHSGHMVPCFDPYVNSLRRVGVKAQQPSNPRCAWISSVYSGKPVDDQFQLSDLYWAENLTKPVLFSQAITAAVSAATSFNLALEIGSHPALQAPASQTIQEVVDKKLPYQGVLSRNSSATEAVSSCLGMLWSHLGHDVTNLHGCEITLAGQKQATFSLCQGLPTYQWNHENSYWHESRRSKKIRLRQDPFHPLLGHVSPDSAKSHLSWKNILKPNEITWLNGHRLQGQTVFPASGYVSTALEAAKALVAGKGNIRLIELQDFHIHQAIAFDGDDTSIEVLIELSKPSSSTSTEVTARFSYSAALGGDDTDLTLVADGDLKVYLGDASPDLLPDGASKPPYLFSVEPSELYNFMDKLEYNFSGPFRSLHSLERKFGKAACSHRRSAMQDGQCFLIHPVELDAAFQSIMVAHSYPDDGQMRTLHLPSSISTIRVNPALLGAAFEEGETFTFDSNCNRPDSSQSISGFSGSVNVHSSHSPHTAIQVDQLNFKPMGTATTQDRKLFYKLDWVPESPDGIAASAGIQTSETDAEVLSLGSRMSSYYMRQFDEDVPEDSWARSETPLCHYLNYAREMTGRLKQGRDQYLKSEWLNDSLEDILNEIKSKQLENTSMIKLMRLVGDTMPRVFAGETTMLEHLRESGLLDDFYANSICLKQSAAWLSQIVKQLTDRHPQLNILEIGAGTGGATKGILKTIGKSFGHYTFTDISSSFFQQASEHFSDFQSKMSFKVLNAERDPRDQGFGEGQYDVVVASFVIHATVNLDNTMRNLRKLLKPGGFIVIGEGNSDSILQAPFGFIFGTLPGWWLGVDDGRTLTPLINTDEWNTLLHRTGFSGIDATVATSVSKSTGIVPIVSQAVDDRISFLREPLSHPISVRVQSLVIVGGETEQVGSLAKHLARIFEGLAPNIIIFEHLQDIDFDALDPESAFLILSELDQPVFKELTAKKWRNLRYLFEHRGTRLWITSGRLDDEPFSNMLVGFGRSARNETEGLRLQFVDVPNASLVNARTIAECLFRLHADASKDQGILYTPEPELLIDVEGNKLVPRYQQISSANDRYNSRYRTIIRTIEPPRDPIELQQSMGGFSLSFLSRFDDGAEACAATNLELKITHSVVSAITTPMGYRFVALGVSSSNDIYLTLLPSLKSTLSVPESSAILCRDFSCSPQFALSTAVARLTAAAIVDPHAAGERIMVHNASALMAEVIASYAVTKGVSTIFTTDHEQPPSSVAWVHIPSFLGKSELLQLIPNDISCFVGLSNDGSANEASILLHLPRHVRVESSKTIYSPTATETPTPSTEKIGQVLETSANWLGLQESGEHKPNEPLSLEDLVRGEQPDNPISIVDWTSSTKALPVQVQRFDSKPLFRGDRTYWLCGMSRSLAISLCDWMISHGARHLAITSRNPTIEESWLKAHQTNGIAIQISACDVTNAMSLGDIHRKIADMLPPIAGVLNGAMVLKDVAISNMTMEQMTDVVEPKVLGSIHLDQIFHDVNLDFFISLSSVHSIIGAAGQANYSAANMGVCALAARRRKRGLNASCVNLGTILGVGYFAQSGRQLNSFISRNQLMHLSEDDFHQIFAEAIEAGYPDSSHGPELTTGLLDATSDAESPPKWALDPKFANLLVRETAPKEAARSQENSLSIQEQLSGCSKHEDVFQVVKKSFSSQLQKTLRHSIPDEDIFEMDGRSLGLDSLISVDIRLWFLKNFQVNIPVLKIMGGEVNLASLVEYAANSLPTTLIPHVGAKEEV